MVEGKRAAMDKHGYNKVLALSPIGEKKTEKTKKNDKLDTAISQNNNNNNNNNNNKKVALVGVGLIHAIIQAPRVSNFRFSDQD